MSVRVTIMRVGAATYGVGGVKGKKDGNRERGRPIDDPHNAA